MLKLQHYIVCPQEADERGSRNTSRACEPDWYRLAVSSPQHRLRLVRLARELDNPRFAEAMFATIGHRGAGTKTDFLFLLRALEDKPALWREGIHVLTDEMIPVDPEFFREIEPDMARLWRDSPTLRGSVLYAMVMMDEPDLSGREPVDWQAFPRRFGPVGRQEYEAYLRHGPHAVAFSWALIPVLSPGWSRTALLLPHIDEHRDNYIFSSRRGGVLGTLSRLMRSLRDSGQGAEIQQVVSYLHARKRAHPAEAEEVDILLERAAGLSQRR